MSIVVFRTRRTIRTSGEPSGEPGSEHVRAFFDPNEDADGDGFTPNDGDCDDGNGDANLMHLKSRMILMITVMVMWMKNGKFDDDGDGFSERDGDCNDADELINPNAQDILDDGIDQDCSGADLSCDTTTEVEWIVDFPATGTGSCDWGNAAIYLQVMACYLPSSPRG